MSGFRSRIAGATNGVLGRFGLEVRRSESPSRQPLTGDPPEGVAALASCPSVPRPSAELVAWVRERYATEFPISPDCPLSPEDIERRIGDYLWASPFTFGGRPVPQTVGSERFDLGRFMHMFPALLSFTGGSLEGKSVLDVACHNGFWSIQARALGADRVMGVEANARSIEQAKLILEITGLDRISYGVQNAYELSPENPGAFDVVLYLGLLYHLDKPVEALQRVFDITREVAVIDTQVIPSAWPVCGLYADQPPGEHRQFHSNLLKMIPSRGAVVMMLRHAGFREVYYVPKTWDRLPRAYVEDRRETLIALR